MSAASPGDHPPRLAGADHGLAGEDRRQLEVVVPDVVGRDLVGPEQGAGAPAEHHERVGVTNRPWVHAAVRALPGAAPGIWVRRPPVDPAVPAERGRVPGPASRRLLWGAPRFGNGVEAPADGAGLRVEGIEDAAAPRGLTCGARVDETACRQRSDRDRVQGARQARAPALGARALVECERARVRVAEDEPAAEREPVRAAVRPGVPLSPDQPPVREAKRVDVAVQVLDEDTSGRCHGGRRVDAGEADLASEPVVPPHAELLHRPRRRRSGNSTSARAVRVRQ